MQGVAGSRAGGAAPVETQEMIWGVRPPIPSSSELFCSLTNLHQGCFGREIDKNQLLLKQDFWLWKEMENGSYSWHSGWGIQTSKYLIFLQWLLRAANYSNQNWMGIFPLFPFWKDRKNIKPGFTTKHHTILLNPWHWNWIIKQTLWMEGVKPGKF